jgi:hypothetical protein
LGLARYAAGSRCEPINTRRRALSAADSAVSLEESAAADDDVVVGWFSAAPSMGSVGLAWSPKSLNVNACPLG